MAKFEIFEDYDGEYKWRLRDDRQSVIAISLRGYVRKEDCLHEIEMMMKICPDADIDDQSNNIYKI